MFTLLSSWRYPPEARYHARQDAFLVHRHLLYDFTNFSYFMHFFLQPTRPHVETIHESHGSRFNIMHMTRDTPYFLEEGLKCCLRFMQGEDY